MSGSVLAKMKALLANPTKMTIEKHLSLDDKIRQLQPRSKKFDFENDLFHSIKWLIWIFVFGDIEKPSEADTDEELQHKALGLYYQSRYYKFVEKLAEKQKLILEHFDAQILQRCGSKDHPIYVFFERLQKYRELHIRRLKTSPTKNRVKKDVGYHVVDAYTSDTIEQMEFDNAKNGQMYRWLILVPLPSDRDINQIDPCEERMTYEMAIAVKNSVEDNDLFGDEDPIEAPEGICVHQDMSHLLQFVHNVAHFEMYVHDYILTAIKGISTQQFLEKHGSATGCKIIKDNLDAISCKRNFTEKELSDDALFEQVVHENIEYLPFEVAPLKDFYATWDELWKHLAGEHFYLKTMKRLPKSGASSKGEVPTIITHIGICRHIAKSMLELEKKIKNEV